MTRMWMVHPEILCNQHLLGEHNELHKAVGSLRRGRHIRGYVRNNCLEVHSLRSRHDLLASEMLSRGFNHRSPLPEPHWHHLEPWERDYRIDRFSAFCDLVRRCPACAKSAYAHFNRLRAADPSNPEPTKEEA